MKKIVLIEILFALFINITIAQELIWKHTGGPMGGIVGDMAISSIGDIYAGVYSYMGTSFQFKYYSGLYKSTDNGESWYEIETQFDPFEIYALYITKEDHILVGTNYQGRIYRSTDEGQTWENNNSGYDTGECWAFGESNDGILFAGNGEGYVYRSTNYGDSWEFTVNLMSLVFVTDKNNEVYCGTHYGLYKTTDNGLNWLMNGSFIDTPVSSILIDSNNNIYIGTGYYDKGNGVYYSTNGGGNWIHLGLEGKVVLSLAFDSKGNLYAGTKQDGLFKTTDMGQIWVQYQNGISGIQVFRLKINKKDDIFIGSENEGVYKSTDGEESFNQVGLPISHIQNIDFSTDKNLIFASTPSGVQSYNRTTGFWENKGLREVEAVSVSPSGDLYAATFLDGIYRSTDDGDNWEKINMINNYVYNFKAITDSILVDATFPAVRISTNQGNSWDTTNIRVSGYRNSIIYDKNNQKMYIHGFLNQSKIFSSTDFGQSFSEIEAPSTFGSKNGLAINSSEDVFFTSDGLYRSNYIATNWTKVYTKTTYCIFIDSKDIIYSAVEDGIIRSANNGSNWEYIFTENMPRTFAHDLKTDGVNLYIATNSYGLYELQIITDVNDINDMVRDFNLYQNYPNPFNPTTKISFTIPTSPQTSLLTNERGRGEVVSLKVYDILGREIRTLVNEPKQPGTYEIEFDAKGLPSGVYFYKIKSGSYTETKKMILLR